jgi:hypothetical protein
MAQQQQVVPLLLHPEHQLKRVIRLMDGSQQQVEDQPSHFHTRMVKLQTLLCMLNGQQIH